MMKDVRRTLVEICRTVVTYLVAATMLLGLIFFSIGGFLLAPFAGAVEILQRMKSKMMRWRSKR